MFEYLLIFLAVFVLALNLILREKKECRKELDINMLYWLLLLLFVALKTWFDW